MGPPKSKQQPSTGGLNKVVVGSCEPFEAKVGLLDGYKQLFETKT